MRALKRLLTLWADATLAAGAGALWAASRARPLPRGEEIPEPPARIVTMSGHGEMFVREAQGLQPGEPTVLLLHGWMFPADLHWVTSYRPLSTFAHVLATDHRGHGRGPRLSQPFRLTDVADDAAALVRTLGVGPVIAVGYSLGGPVAQLLWQRHPDIVSGPVL